MLYRVIHCVFRARVVGSYCGFIRSERGNSLNKRDMAARYAQDVARITQGLA